MPDSPKNRTWARYVKYLYFDGNLPRALERKCLMKAAYDLAPALGGRVVHVGPEAPDDASFSVISLLIPGYNQVDLLYDRAGTVVAFSWPTKEGKPRFIDCPPMSEAMAKAYGQFFIAPRSELLAPLTPDMLADMLPSDRKLLASNYLQTVGQVIFHVVAPAS